MRKEEASTSVVPRKRQEAKSRSMMRQVHHVVKRKEEIRIRKRRRAEEGDGKTIVRSGFGAIR